MTPAPLDTANSDRPSRADWLLALYSHARDDIRWAKERSWQALVLCYTLLGGLLALRESSFADAPSWPFIPFVLVASGLTIWYMCDLHSAAKGARQSADAIKVVMPLDVQSLLPEAGGDKHHDAYLIAQIACVFIAACVTVLALCSYASVLRGPA